MTILTASDKFLIRKCGNEIQTLCRFNRNKNIFNRFVDGNNHSFFLSAETPFEQWETAGELFHEGWDDIAPLMSKFYGTVGANHGSPFAYSVTMIRHWYTDNDIGKVLTDDAGNRFILVQVVSLSNFIIHSEVIPGQIPCFNHLQGALYDNGRKLNTTGIRKVQLGHARSDHLLSHYRFNQISLTVDGNAIPENRVIECSRAHLHWDIDLCLADALLEYIKVNPGRRVSTTAPELRAAAHLEFDFLFQIANVYTIDCKFEFLQDIHAEHRFGMIQHYGTIGFDRHEKLVPKLKPFELEYSTGKTVIADFNRPTVMESGIKANRYFYKADCLDPADPPLRYVDIFGNGEKRQFGVALGYSSTCGVTAKNSADRGDLVFMLPGTNKIYPFAYFGEFSPAGKKFTVSAYRQYFDPASSNAAVSYGHYETDGYWFYACYDTGTQDSLQLPEELADRNFEIVEISGDITLPASGKLDKNAKLEISAAPGSSFTLKIKP